MRMSMTATAHGAGPGPTMAELTEFARHLPETARTSVKSSAPDPREQRDQGSWTMTASWSLPVEGRTGS